MEGLCLTRRPNEAVVINAGDGKLITVTITQIRGDKVRLNIQAPRNIPVHRVELLARKKVVVNGASELSSQTIGQSPLQSIIDRQKQTKSKIFQPQMPDSIMQRIAAGEKFSEIEKELDEREFKEQMT